MLARLLSATKTSFDCRYRPVVQLDVATADGWFVNSVESVLLVDFASEGTLPQEAVVASSVLTGTPKLVGAR